PGEVVDGRGHLGEQGGVAVEVPGDVDADAHAAGDRGHRGQRGPGLEDGIALVGAVPTRRRPGQGQQVVEYPEVVEAALVRDLPDLPQSRDRSVHLNVLETDPNWH